jgi:hypothetical protein
MKPKRHRLRQSEKTRILEILADQMEREDGIVAAYAFGSFQNGESYRDIDIAILMQTTPEAAIEVELDLERILGKVAGYPVDVRILNGAPVSFTQAAIRGKVILDSVPLFRANFENHVLKRYFDFAPYRRRYLAEVPNAPL